MRIEDEINKGNLSVEIYNYEIVRDINGDDAWVGATIILSQDNKEYIVATRKDISGKDYLLIEDNSGSLVPLKGKKFKIKFDNGYPRYYPPNQKGHPSATIQDILSAYKKIHNHGGKIHPLSMEKE